MAPASAGYDGVSAFPPDLPDDLDDRNSIVAHDWQAFRQVTTMENHWQRPGWTPGRRSYHWMLSFHGAENLQRLAARCQAQLPASIFDPVPLDALHLTLDRVAFTDEVTSETVRAVADAAVPRVRAMAPLYLSVGPLAGSRGAIRFSVGLWSPLRTLHRELTTATRAIVGDRCVMDTDHFRPHVSIAYANTTVLVPSLVPLLERLRSLSPVHTTVRSVALVELRREGRNYRYDVLAALPTATAVT
jgi:2'-5' RNA ligase